MWEAVKQLQVNRECIDTSWDSVISLHSDLYKHNKIHTVYMCSSMSLDKFIQSCNHYHMMTTILVIICLCSSVLLTCKFFSNSKVLNLSQISSRHFLVTVALWQPTSMLGPYLEKMHLQMSALRSLFNRDQRPLLPATSEFVRRVR